MNRSARAAGLATAAVSLLVAFATPVAAQNEQALKTYFEGRPITLRLDMPGWADGVDIHVNQPQSLDYKKYRDNLKRYGIAIPYGDSSRITLIKLKKDLVEFQISAVGFGTFDDDTSTSSNNGRLEKTEGERGAEKRPQGGSRLNLRWSSRVPADITPEEIEKALVKYVDFGNSGDFS